MKKFYIILFTFIASSCCYSQGFGINLGGNYTKLTSSNSKLYDMSYGLGFDAGIHFNIPLNRDKVYLSPGISYFYSNSDLTLQQSLSYRGSNKYTPSGTLVKERLQGVEVPIEIQYILGNEIPITLFVSGTPSFVFQNKIDFVESNSLLEGNSYKVPDELYNKFNVYVGGGLLVNLNVLFGFNSSRLLSSLKLSYERTMTDFTKSDEITLLNGNYDNSRMTIGRFNFGISFDFVN